MTCNIQSEYFISVEHSNVMQKFVYDIYSLIKNVFYLPTFTQGLIPT